MRKIRESTAKAQSQISETEMLPEVRLHELLQVMAQLESFQQHDRGIIGHLNHEKDDFEQRLAQLKRDKSQLSNQSSENHELQVQLVETLREHEKNQQQLLQEIELKQRQMHEQLKALRQERDAALAQKAQVNDPAGVSKMMPAQLQILLQPKILLLIIACSLILSFAILFFLL